MAERFLTIRPTFHIHIESLPFRAPVESKLHNARTYELVGSALWLAESTHGSLVMHLDFNVALQRGQEG